MTENTLLILAAVALDLIFGDPKKLAHPVQAIGRFIELQEQLLRRLLRNELIGGGILVVITVGGTWLAVSSLISAGKHASPGIGFAISLYFAWTAVAARSLHGESRMVAQALEAGDLPEARRRLSLIVGRDTENLDEQGVLRATVETVAENTSDGVIAPLFYLMLGGPALALAYKAVNTLDSMIGYKNERYLKFGRVAARLDDLANFIPARLTGLLMVVAAPLAGLSFGNALRILRRDGRNHSSPNAGIPEAAAAGALGVRLGGASFYGGKEVGKPTIGDPLHPVSLRSWRGAVRLLYGAEALLVAGYLLVRVWR